MKARFRVGCVPYVNARPLVACFDQPNEFVEVVYDVPSRLPALLDSGEVDAILVSSIEYLRREDLVVIGEVGIMSNGPVASVRMLSKVPLREIQTLALDESSMTSNMLAQIILAERGVRPSLVTMEPDQAAMLAACDACVLIGDKGLEADGTGLVDIDLGAAWTELTGESFTWAVWLARADKFPEPRWDEVDNFELLSRVLFMGMICCGFHGLHEFLDLEANPSYRRLSELRREERRAMVAVNVSETESRRKFVIDGACERSGWSPKMVEAYLSNNVRHSGKLWEALVLFHEYLLKWNLLGHHREFANHRGSDTFGEAILRLIP